jgi:aromatic-L-amino-acid decarboxylase
MPELDVPWPPDLSLVAFRPRDGGEDAAARLLDTVNASGRVWLSSAPIRGRTFLRICILSHRTHRERVDEAIEIIRAAVSALA